MRNYSNQNAVNTDTRLCAAILRMQLQLRATVWFIMLRCDFLEHIGHESLFAYAFCVYTLC